MTRWFTSALTLTLLIAFTGLATAQPRPGAGKAMDKAAPAQPRDLRPVTTTGIVTHVDPVAKTFTVNANGKLVTFGATNLATLPEVGMTAEVTHHAGPGGMAQATTVNSSKSNQSEFAGGDAGRAALRRPSEVAGKVTHVDLAAKTFTLIENGKPVTVNATNITALPKVGDSVVVTYSGVPGGALFATTVKSGKSNQSD